MWGLLSDFFDSMLFGALKKLLLGAGLTLASNTVFMNIVRSNIADIKSNLGSMGADTLALLHLGGFDIALSILLSAILTRLVLSPPRLFIMPN